MGISTRMCRVCRNWKVIEDFIVLVSFIIAEGISKACFWISKPYDADQQHHQESQRALCVSFDPSVGFQHGSTLPNIN